MNERRYALADKIMRAYPSYGLTRRYIGYCMGVVYRDNLHEFERAQMSNDETTKWLEDNVELIKEEVKKQLIAGGGIT